MTDRHAVADRHALTDRAPTALHMPDDEFERLARCHMDMLFRIAYGYLRSRSDADDAVQDVLVALYARAEVFESEEHARRWLTRVVINKCKDVLRASWRRVEMIDDYEATLVFEDPCDLDLFRAVMALDRRYRVPLLLHYCEGYAVREIAQLMGIPAGTVGTRLARGRKRLRSLLEGGMRPLAEPNAVPCPKSAAQPPAQSLAGSPAHLAAKPCAQPPAQSRAAMTRMCPKGEQ